MKNQSCMRRFLSHRRSLIQLAASRTETTSISRVTWDARTIAASLDSFASQLETVSTKAVGYR